MVKFFILTIYFLISSTLFVFGESVQQSIPPVAGNTENTDKPKENCDTNDNVTSPSHVPISINAYAQNRESERKGEQKHSNAEPSKWTDPLNILTGLLVGATIGLIVVGFLQWLIYKATLATTKAIQRAYIHFEHLRFSQERITLPQITKGADITCYFHNFGLTQGTLTTGYTKTKVSKDTPKVPDYANHPSIWNGTETIPPRGEAIFPMPIDIKTTDIESVRGGHFLFIYGYFTYRDIFDEKREIAFFMQYDPNKERFFKVERPGYNRST